MRPTTPTDGDADHDDMALESLFSASSDRICPFADYILVFKDKYLPTIKLEVSSCILSMASPVFKTMFSKKFAEGQRKEGEGRKEIDIHEHPPSMRVLCRILHLQPPREKDDTSKIDMLKLALLIDEYQCVEAVRNTTRGMLENIIAPFGDHDKPLTIPLQDLVPVAYILDQPEQFRYLTSTLVLNAKSIRTKDFWPEALDLLPPQLIDSLNAQRIAALHELSNKIMILVDIFNTAANALDCPQSITSFMATLRGLELFPLRQNDLENIQEVLHKLNALIIPVIKTDARKCSCKAVSQAKAASGAFNLQGWTYRSINGESQNWHSPLCDGYIFPADGDVKDAKQRHVDFIVQNIKDICVGACLDCARKGEKQKKEDCRVEHSQPWDDSYLRHCCVRVGFDTFVDLAEYEQYVMGNRWEGEENIEYPDVRLIPEWWESMW